MTIGQRLHIVGVMVDPEHCLGGHRVRKGNDDPRLCAPQFELHCDEVDIDFKFLSKVICTKLTSDSMSVLLQVRV